MRRWVSKVTELSVFTTKISSQVSTTKRFLQIALLLQHSGQNGMDLCLACNSTSKACKLDLLEKLQELLMTAAMAANDTTLCGIILDFVS